MLKSSKQQVDRGDATWADKFSVMLTPHNSQYAPSAARFETHLPSYLFPHRRRYTQHHHVTFKLREVVKPYKKVVGHAAVSLQGAVAACERGKAYSFLVPLRLQGLVCGMRLPPSLFSIPSTVICLSACALSCMLAARFLRETPAHVYYDDPRKCLFAGMLQGKLKMLKL